MAEADLQRRIKVLDDIEQIRRLKAQYFAHCDDNYNPDALAEMFVEDAVWDVGSGVSSKAGKRFEASSPTSASPVPSPYTGA